MTTPESKAAKLLGRKQLGGNMTCLETLQLALEALETSEPKMKHYPEPVERHKKAIEAVKDAISLGGNMKLPYNAHGWLTVCACCKCAPNDKSCNFNCSCHSTAETEFPNFGKDIEVPHTKPPKNWKAYE